MCDLEVLLNFARPHRLPARSRPRRAVRVCADRCDHCALTDTPVLCVLYFLGNYFLDILRGVR